MCSLYLFEIPSIKKDIVNNNNEKIQDKYENIFSDASGRNN